MFLDNDGWEYATAYHRAFEASVLGLPGVLVPHGDHLRFLWTEHVSFWPVVAQNEILHMDARNRARFAAVLGRGLREGTAV
ncbi:MAG TPA: hypothetical protein VFG23_12880 [Polyangia bacterium]|nr:hypothetical protein [Polyangia bacterium]